MPEWLDWLLNLRMNTPLGVLAAVGAAIVLTALVWLLSEGLRAICRRMGWLRWH